MKKIEFTKSPKEAGFSTKEQFLAQLSVYGFEHSKMTKKNNQVDILVCDDLSSNSNKIKMAKELQAMGDDIEIMTYQQMKEAFDLEGDIEE